MYKLRQILLTAFANFRRWKKNPQIILAFCLAFIVSFLLSDKVLVFAKEHDTILQMAEPFIWTFGDAQSVLIISLLLLLLFADMPNLGNDVPLFLVRIDRKVWVLGQILYLILPTFLFLCFILLSTCILASSQAFVANMWSDTAAVLGYSIVMAGIILFFNMVKDNGGMIAGIIYSGFGFLLTPDTLSDILHIPAVQSRYANIIFGWISPLNHATYYMHSFGYDLSLIHI